MKLKPIFLLSIAIMIPIAIGITSYRYGRHHVASPASSPEGFPILSRVEIARDYGYFIGDVIPLTVVIETTGDVVVDLVNLPHKGESHGLFEVRDLTITSTPAAHQGIVYKAHYNLQYFGVTPLTAPFEPLEILYALPEHRAAATGTYTYKSLFTQPVPINLTRLGPHHQHVKVSPNGPVDDGRTGMIRTGFVVGTIFLVLALCGWGWEWRQRQQRQRRAVLADPTAVETTLQLLRHEGERFRPTPAVPAATRLSHLIRSYVQSEYDVLTLTLTTAELQDALNDKCFGPELLDILVRCDDLKYQAASTAEAEEQQLWWETITLFEKLERGTSL